MQSFAEFVENSLTAYHTVHNLSKILERKGFKEGLTGEKCFVKFDGALAAFIKPKNPKRIKILAAHTDSPALKLKPHPEYQKEGAFMLGVEVYGAPLLSSWLNRDLVLAGRNSKGELINLKQKVTLPQLAIHLDREVNEKGLILNRQEHLNLLAGLQSLKIPNGAELFAVSAEKVTELSKGIVQGPRLDNLTSCFEIIEAIPAKSSDSLIALYFFNHEEIGSGSYEGAESSRFIHLLEEVVGDRKVFLQLLNETKAVSVDVAHAVHPNYADRHEARHRPRLGEGIVVKWNANQKYATDAVSANWFSKSQSFVSRSDMPCGSTIGPILASKLGVKTVDIGIPILSMHSIREVIGWNDHLEMIKRLKDFLSSP